MIILCSVVCWMASGSAMVVGQAGVADPPVVLERRDDQPLPAAGPAGARRIRSNVVYSVGPFDSIQVNVNGQGNNITGDAANEPSIAIDPGNPDRIAIGWRQFDNVASNFRQAGWAYSDDGGQTWTFPGVLDPGVFRSDPVLDADEQGNFYYYSLTEDFTCDLFRSTDGGVTWPNVVPAFGGDKAWMIVDRTGGPGQGNIYAKWQTFFNCCGENTFTRSTDGGQSFEEPLAVPLGPSFGTLTAAPNGAVYVAGIEAVFGQDFDTIVFARSSNAWNPAVQPTFELSMQVDLGGSVEISAGPNPGGLLGQVQVVIDLSGGDTAGNVYILGSVDPPGPDPLDVRFIRSTDGGLTWSSPAQINPDFLTNAWQWFGTVAVAPDGRLDVVWNDTRRTGQVNLSELFYAYSFDGGQTWSPNVVVGQIFDSFIGWPNQNKIGDYYDMISDSAGARLAYAATYNGEQDVYLLRLGDCNDNGVHDGLELQQGSADLNGNNILDQCECFADLDGDGLVDAADLAVLLGDWGFHPGAPADFNGDNFVDAADLATLLGNWGPC